MSAEEEKGNNIRQVGLCLTIPFALGVPPVLGWLIGSWLDQLLGTDPVLMYLLIVLGFVSGFREVYRITKRFGNEN